MFIVQKYGGTSLGSLERVQIVARHIKNTLISNNHSNTKLIVVVSAMGQHTNELLYMARSLNSHPPKRELDMLLTVGERISMSFLSIALHRYNIKAISLTGSQCGIITDENHCNAKIKKILVDRLNKYIRQYDVIIIAGFQGVSELNKEITTLGRGGSDLTAIALACALKAQQCDIYTDVDGIYTADPNVVPNAKKIHTIRFDIVSNMAWAGAKIVHHRAADLALKYKLPYKIKSSFDFAVPGTLVCEDSIMESSTIQTIVHKNNVAFIQFKILVSHIEILSDATEWLWNQGESLLINQRVYQQQYVYVNQVLTQNIVDLYLDFIRQSIKNKNDVIDGFELQALHKQLCLITILGNGFLHDIMMYKKIFNLIEAKPYIVDIKNNMLSFCILDSSCDFILQELHKAFIEQ